jgi:hypothetical protein
MPAMDPFSIVTYLARMADGSVGRMLAGLGGISLLLLVVLGLTYVFGAVAADLLAPEPADVFAAPFRWRI